MATGGPWGRYKLHKWPSTKGSYSDTWEKRICHEKWVDHLSVPPLLCPLTPCKLVLILSPPYVVHMYSECRHSTTFQHDWCPGHNDTPGEAIYSGTGNDTACPPWGAFSLSSLPNESVQLQAPWHRDQHDRTTASSPAKGEEISSIPTIGNYYRTI